MNFREAQKAARFYRPVMWTDRLFPRTIRRPLYKLFTFVFAVFVATYIIFSFGSYNFVYGISLILFSLWAVWSAWEMFYNALKAHDPHETGITPIMAEVALSPFKKDATRIFLTSTTGKECMRRFGIGKKVVATYLRGRQATLSSKEVRFDHVHFVDLATLARVLLQYDESFKEFIFKNAIQEEELIHLCQWIERRYYARLTRTRWWTKDALLRIPSIGVAFSYGRAYTLEKFARKVEPMQAGVFTEYFQEEFERLEKVLVRSKEANALIVGSRENHSIINLLQKNINDGTVYSHIEHKELFVLDAEDLISSTHDKAGFEQEFMKILREAERAGNIILVLYDLPRLISSAQALNIAILPILEPYLISSDLQVIAFAESSAYHKILASNEIIQERFEKMLVKEKEKEMIRTVVENYIATLEAQHSIFFEYKAVNALVLGAERFFVEKSPINEITDILVDLSQKIFSMGKKVVTKQDVLGLFENKTGIPLQKADDTEKEKLVHLEEFLHKRVVGQDQAIRSISDAMRRVRSGISNPDRPIGTFLFLGPTGVGKTETAKALAENFFEGEDKIQRLDMSEFSSPNALSRLIGSFETGEVGVLSTMLREKPYGVLLLDEFEKATTEVHDLFLQILDEGVFSDMRGDKVNARNTIIIATSNAGSDLVLEYLSQNKDITEHQSTIVTSIIDKGIFKPELVNRFDDVVIFHSLEKEHTAKIVEIMMKALSERLSKKGIKVELAPDAVDFIITEGTSLQFGARELNRVLQDKVESTVARLLLEKKATQGDTVRLTKTDLSV